MSMTSAEIRRAFLRFFESRDHQVVPSESLIPVNDDTLLFVNAGMVPFKDVFLGTEQRDYRRATTSQRCVRAGGKHNDLENVGYTARHHTFFEMLGNFSFGDYFKREAITYAWDFLTKEVGLPAEKLWVTVFEEDDEAWDIWSREIGVPTERMRRIGAADNFWQMGDTGPCGPCSEIFYDHGPDVWGGPPGSPEEDGDRFIEIWNLVFMQYNRSADGTLHPLPKPSVDTGMGLERIAAVLQGVHSNYETDTFQALIQAAARETGATDLSHQSLRVIADHIRSCAFLVTDGVLPSNEGRGYVLRRIIRRAVRHGHKLGAREPFFHRLVPALVAEMGDAFPELAQAEKRVTAALLKEEQQFARTIARGMALLEDALAALQPGDTLAGEVAFKLYDTYGFPLDLTADITRESEIQVDQAGFDAAMAAQRARAQQASRFGTDYNDRIQTRAETTFTGYTTATADATILELYLAGEQVEELPAGSSGLVILDQTPFYGESGGQVGDQGVLEVQGEPAFVVTDTQLQGQAVVHSGRADVALAKGQTVTAVVDDERRDAIRRNHSATHLLHAALKKVLGEHVVQKGSLVDEDKLRFDFAHGEALTSTQVYALEQEVNREVYANRPAEIEVMELEAAKAAGAEALFGEKYAAQVRTIRFGAYSFELCGGTHVQRTGDIGPFRLVSEGGVAAGVRRVEAWTGARALDYTQQQDAQLQLAAERLKTEPAGVAERINQQLQRQKQLEKELHQLQQELSRQQGAGLVQQAETIHGMACVVAEVQDVEPKALREMVDDLKNQLGTGVVLLGLRRNDKVNLIAGVTKDLTDRLQAGELVREAAAVVGGKGGGRPDMAQAGGAKPDALPEALATARQWLQDNGAG